MTLGECRLVVESILLLSARERRDFIILCPNLPGRKSLNVLFRVGIHSDAQAAVNYVADIYLGITGRHPPPQAAK